MLTRILVIAVIAVFSSPMLPAADDEDVSPVYDTSMTGQLLEIMGEISQPGSSGIAEAWTGYDQNSPHAGVDLALWQNCFSRFGSAYFDLDRCLKPDPADPGAPAITISDLAAFTPNPVTLSTQPDGWGVAHVPTNFVTDAAPHVQSGQLLGQPVQVRWIPVAFHYDYGDGHTATVEHPGVRWFDDEPWAETPTSHVYDSKDDVVVQLTIEYAAEFDFGSGWIQVQGTITQALPPYPLKLYEVRTVLTRGDCYQYPNDPGCG